VIDVKMFIDFVAIKHNCAAFLL